MPIVYREIVADSVISEAGLYDIDVVQDATVALVFVFYDENDTGERVLADLSGFEGGEAVAQIRTERGELLADFVGELDVEQSMVTFGLDRAATLAMTRSGVWDGFVIDEAGLESFCVARGKVQLHKRVTVVAP